MAKLNARYEARFYSKLQGGRVQCLLCPRRCNVPEGGYGFCRVRKNERGTLLAASYGRAIHISEEVIETEGVYHFEPGSRILSVGNIGCNMSCVYCQNWRFSQVEHLDERYVMSYTPEDIVRMAIARGIDIISWTYDDPAIWIEFVIDTASLAKKHGLYNLFKSALFINTEPLNELMEVIDIFSVSVKSLNPIFYREYTGGWISPVLEATRAIYKDSRAHLEISNLVVTEANDRKEDFLGVIEWVRDELSPDVPLHFVRFHPDYRYISVEKTPLEKLEEAHRLAKRNGIRHCYLGNLFAHNAMNTYCRRCGALLVERRGLNAEKTNIERSGDKYVCKTCGTSSPIKSIAKEEALYEDVNIQVG